MQMISAILYSMWNERNNRVFRDKDKPVRDLVDHALQTLYEYQLHKIETLFSNTHPKPPSVAGHDTCWNPPPSSTLKINVDAHLTGDGHWGLGWVVRRFDGRCVGAATKVLKGSDDATEAEATGLLEAIQWAQRQRYTRIIFESDAEAVVKAIQNGSYPRLRWGQIAKQAARAIKENDDFSVSWVRRENNYVAHTLARWAILEPNKQWIHALPICISHHVQKDMGHVT
jgi:ribonuclease HI